ncbi:hypothetical protein AC579_3637 [Pseudocercospora musae]|uniref:Uncharacterized protein n=1 Tax=Pseudocercospora musae TaxID=113226 RepID=A0A139IT90_9PEZI|nr:hypothetical protein AC579_3637 [Pseudocercospora musae]
MNTVKIKSQSHPAAERQRTSHNLFDLPDELWARIGGEVVDVELREKQEWITTELADLPFCLWIEVDQTILLFRPSIIQTCHKLRRELVPYYCRTFQPIVLCSPPCAPGPHARIVHCIDQWFRGADLNGLNGLRLFRQLSETDSTAMNILELCRVPYRSRWKELNEQDKFGHLRDKFMLGCFEAQLERGYEVLFDSRRNEK